MVSCAVIGLGNPCVIQSLPKQFLAIASASSPSPSSSSSSLSSSSSSSRSNAKIGRSSGCYNKEIIVISKRQKRFPKRVIVKQNGRWWWWWCCVSSSSSSSSYALASDKGQSAKTRNDIHRHSLKLLEWDKLCDLVASFASTPLARQATKAQLWSLNRSYEESLRLLEETNAAIEMHKHGACRLDFTVVRPLLVKSATQNAQRGLPVNSNEAMAVAAMLEFAHNLQLNLKATIKEDADWHNQFMPLSQLISEMVINSSLFRIIHRFIDEDGSVKDSASPTLRRSRDQVRMLETKLHQLMDSIIRNKRKETSFLEVSKVDGRWCINSGNCQLTDVKGLLLPSNSGTGNIVEPLLAVPLNDELQRARALVAQAEADVLMMLTEEMQKDLDDIRNILDTVIRLDTINARATYSLSFGGACPNLYLPEDINGSSFKREWILYMPKAYHPLLLHQHRENLRDLQKDGKNAAIVSAQELHKPVPFDFFIAQTTKVLVITGPNTGGKTICLKTVGLAAMMAKSGLHVLSSESVQIPWFDSIFADIGDEQSLSQSLSTFSGHLKNIIEIRSQSTNQSLVLLDEVGAGTNPLEGAALGMSLLESFADSGALLTIATTHYGELKSLKYSDNAFENACMEFDEVNLNPTYKIIWGVPGRSNAINISEKLGLPSTVVRHARELYGADSAEINEVICAMEKFEQMFGESLYQTQHHLLLSRNLYEKLLLARRKVIEHATVQRYRKMKEISEVAAMARSALHKKVLRLRTHKRQPSQPTLANEKPLLNSESKECTGENSPHLTASRNLSSIDIGKPSVSAVSKKGKLPDIGDMVYVSTLRREATVLRVDPAKEEMVVQAGNMKLKLKFKDIKA